MHYIIITFAIVVILIWQFKIFLSTKTKIRTFQHIFPQDDSFELGMDEEEEGTAIISHYSNSVLNNIVNSINNYLEKNKGAVSDFHLIKDIVDRNCDSIEEDINTQIPMPLYLGLVGTMLGILIGIGFLVVTGSLNELLNPSSTSTDGKGITELFGGVALAMIASIVGILLTTVGSYLAKEAKKEAERGKNIFLSWIQAELLPELSNDTTAVLEKMTRNLTGFNKTFSENTQELRKTLQLVNESYRNQSELIKSINQLKINNIATVNIEVYEKLKNCTEEIGAFAQFLHSANEYLTSVQSLSKKLDDYENRTQIIENAGHFFVRNEKWLSENFDTANLETKGALERFNNDMKESFVIIRESFDSQTLSFNQMVRDQQESFFDEVKKQRENFHQKLEETNTIVDELKNITAVKTGMMNLEKVTQQQSLQIESLTQAIRQLVEVKTYETSEIKVNTEVPYWVKITGLTVGGLISISCFFYLISHLIKWISHLIN